MAEREPRAGAGSAFDGLPQELLVKILERSKDVSLAAAPVGEPATVSFHFRLVCKEWAAAGMKVITKIRVRDDWPQLSIPHLHGLLQRCPKIKKVDISFGFGQEPWKETEGLQPEFYNPERVVHMKYIGQTLA